MQKFSITITMIILLNVFQASLEFATNRDKHEIEKNTALYK